MLYWSGTMQNFAIDEYSKILIRIENANGNRLQMFELKSSMNLIAHMVGEDFYIDFSGYWLPIHNQVIEHNSFRFCFSLFSLKIFMYGI